MKKRIISIFMVICLIMSLCGCSNSGVRNLQPGANDTTQSDALDGNSDAANTATSSDTYGSGEAVNEAGVNSVSLSNASANVSEAVSAGLAAEGSTDNASSEALGETGSENVASETVTDDIPDSERPIVASGYSSNLEELLVRDYIESHNEYVAGVVAANPDLFTSVADYDGDDEEIDPDSEEFDISELDLSTIEFLSVYRKGTSDPTVAYIQQLLMDLGFMDYAEPTQYYGSMTMEAAKLFQRQNGLEQDGTLGPKSLEVLLSGDAKHYMVKKGMEGSDIKRIQQRLYELGYLDSKTHINGKFDDNTYKAVKSLQKANSLVSDGIIGELTIELLYSEDIVANLLSFGDNGEIILNCQKRLKELGYLTTTPDGKYGNDTLAAVKLFQSRNNLVVDGYLGPTTREVLESSSAVPNGLSIGDEGETVKRVQQLLIKYGYMSSGADTGYFGEVTDKAVRSFQTKNGLSVDGHVGSKTMAKLTGTSLVKADGSKLGGNGGGSDNKDNGGGSGQVDTGYAGSGSVQALLKVALSKVGCKYVWGAKGPDKFDCSGFVYWCLNQVGVKQSYVTSYGWRTIGKYKKITKYSDLKAGDIIVVTGHVGIIGEEGTVIDASSSRSQIAHRKLTSWWKSRFICGWRIFE